MACKIPNIDEFLNKVKNGENVYPIPPNDTYENIEARLKHTRDTVKVNPDTRKYQANDYEFKTRITTLVAERFNKNQTGSPVENVYAEAGTAGHEFLQKYLQGENPGLTLNGWTITQEMAEQLKNVANQIKKQAKEIQDSIDPKKEAKIFVEQTLFDPKQSVGGTADVIVLFSNKSALLYDYKFKFVNQSDFDKEGRFVNYNKVTKRFAEHEMQLGIMANYLKKYYGVTEIVGGRVIPLVATINRWYDETDKKWYLKNKDIGYLETPFDNETILQQALLLPEKIGIQGINKYISSQYAKIRKLESTGKEEDRLKAEVIRNEVSQMVLFNDFDLLVKNIYKEYKEFKKRINEPKYNSDGKPNKKYLTDEELESLYLKLKSAQIIADNTGLFMEKIKNTVSEKEKDKIRESLGKLNTGVKEITVEVDSAVKQRFIADVIGKDVIDEQGNVKMQRGEGFVNNWLFSLSDQQNYFVRSLSQLKLENEKLVADELDKYVGRWAKVNNTVNEWINQNGRNRFIDLVFDKKTNNLIQQLDKKFFAERKKAIENNDVEWFKKHYEINEGKTKEGYEEGLAAFEKRLRSEYSSEGQIQRRLESYKKNNDLWGDSVTPWTNNRLVKIKPEVFKDKKWVTPEYAKLIGTPLEEFYNFYKDSMFTFIKMIDQRDRLKSNFVPWIRQSMVEAVMNGGGLNLERLKNAFMTTLAKSNDSSYLSHDDTGRLEQDVPVYFTNARLDEEGKVIPGEEKSLDFMNSLLLFGKMAMTHKAAKRNAGVANMLVEAYSNSQLYDTDALGNLKRTGSDFAKRDVTELEKEAIRSLRDYYWYGVEMRTKDWTVKLGNSEISMVESARAIKRWWTLTTLSFGIKQAAGGYVSAKINAWIDGAKGVYYNQKQYEEATKKAYQNPKDFLALGLWMDIYTNDILERKLKEVGMDAMDAGKSHLGFFSQSFQDPRYGDFFRKYINERTAMGMWTYESENRDNTLVNTVAMNFGVDKGGNFVRFRKDWFEKDGITLKKEYKDMEYKSIAEIFKYDEKNGPRFEINGKKLSKEESDKLWIKFREAAKRIRNGISGEVGSEEKSAASMTLLGQLLMQYRSWMPGILREVWGGISYDYRTMSVHQGRYRVLGKHLFQDDTRKGDSFKSLVGMAFFRMAQIFWEASSLGGIIRKVGGGEMSFTPDLERIKVEYQLWSENNPDLGAVINIQDYTEMRVAQLNAMIMELRMIMAFIALLMLLGSLLAADDDDEDEFFLRMGYGIIRKAYGELTFTVFPSEYARLTKNPIPLVSIPLNISSSFVNTLDEGRDHFFGENSPYDRTDWAHYSKRFIPGIENISKFIEWTEEDKKYLQEGIFEVRF